MPNFSRKLGFLANCGGRDKKSESQGTKEAPRDLGTLERSWVALLMSVNLSQGPWGFRHLWETKGAETVTTASSPRSRRSNQALGSASQLGRKGRGGSHSVRKDYVQHSEVSRM